MVTIGDVNTFPDVKPDKAQVMKIAEEMLEVYSAWEDYKREREYFEAGHKAAFTGVYKRNILDECADVIQATCNLIAALGVEDFTPYMQACEDRNRERGRM